MNSNDYSNYSAAGVNTEMADVGLERIIRRVRKTWTQGEDIGDVQLDIGQFANIINIGNNQGLCVTTDGVGTKALVAQMMEKYDTIGIDCVAMNVNDVICVGAKPLSMVDYMAIRTPDPDLLDELAIGLCVGAQQSDISISGGEIAQLPDMLAEHEVGHTFDLVGTAVGTVQLDRVVVGQEIVEGDVIIGIESNGVHSNGLSLARHALFKQNNFTIDSDLPELETNLGEELLKPTFIYVKETQEILKRCSLVKALVHITSDGFLNLSRVIGHHGFVINNLPEPHPIFSLIKSYGNVADEEMFSVFNMGIGFCIVINETQANQAISIIESYGKKAHIIGHTIKDERKRVFLDQYDMIGEGKTFIKNITDNNLSAVAI